MKVYCVQEKDMDEWKEICRRWCIKNNAKLLFVNDTSFGCEFQNGQMRHIYLDELADMLGIEM